MEVYSPPRLVPEFTALGYKATWSIDLETGWDLLNKEHRDALLKLIKNVRPRAIMLSPPCTVFSNLQQLNVWRVHPQVSEQRLQIGRELLQVAAEVAALQADSGRGFVLEHPAGAKSWQEDYMVALTSRSDTFVAIFDQCRYGLVSKVGLLELQGSI